MFIKRLLYILPVLLIISPGISGQAYLHTQGKEIVTGDGSNFIIRSIGTGNWMIQEGYMMQTAGVAGTQHEFRDKLEESIGTEKTDSFYISWLQNHFRQIDVDSLASWGFNSIRVALHYKWFTPPIEDEPVPGEITWINTGFDILDSLLDWCGSNQMYLILDMHGAPGGQGANADISDYDDTKPSLWESNANKNKLVALWYRLAERYSDEPWIGGYDLINETNWSFPENNNSQLRNIYERITDTIRLVDQNHIIYIEGNWFANDFGGLTPPWDDNMVYSFHKYWSYNYDNSLNWVTGMRDLYNIPLWLGETGENSNTWFTNLVKLAESKNIGWSWWPVKKPGVNNPLKVEINDDYRQLIEYWKGNASFPGIEEAFQAVLQFSENHRLENCTVQKDVIDAIFRQPYSNELKPFKITHKPGDHIFGVDYALGRNGYAYFDMDTADYHVDTDEYTNWNQGGKYRNDGVDIESCTDNDTTNGYNVGWISDGEWLAFKMSTDSAALYDCIFRTGAQSGNAFVVLEANGNIISDETLLLPTGSWTSWRTTTASDILLPAGDITLKVKFPVGSVNLNYIRFVNPRTAYQAGFEALYCETSTFGNEIYVHLNQPVSSETLTPGDFLLYINNTETQVIRAEKSPDSDYIIIIEPDQDMLYTDKLSLDYSGNTILHEDIPLSAFTKKPVRNNLIEHHLIPGKIEAEDFFTNFGLELESCSDTGGGYNTGYVNPGDYLDYLVYVPQADTFQANFRIATLRSNAQVTLQYEEGEDFVSIKTISIPYTGGWQSWQTTSTPLPLPEGKYLFRLFMKQGEFNLNWFSVTSTTGLTETTGMGNPLIYPVPASDFLRIEFREANAGRRVELYTINGDLVYINRFSGETGSIRVSDFSPGLYLLRIIDKTSILNRKLIIE